VTTLPVIIVDIDDVLHAYGHPHFTKHVERVLGVSYPYEDRVHPYLNAMFPHVTKEQELEIVHMVYDDPEFWEDMPIPYSVEALQILRQHFHPIAVTARPAMISARTRMWLDLHHIEVFREEPIFIGLNGSAENVTTKLGHALAHEAVAMIDDTRHHLDGCAEAGIAGLLFDRPWNRNEPDHEDFIRVHDWREITEQLMRLVEAA
jgi:5'(3')-deoxyribonucleotidase